MKNRLVELRGANGWSQVDLAERLEISRQSVIAIEKGKYDPSLPLAFKIASVFGMTIEDVFEPGLAEAPADGKASKGQRS